MAGAAVLKTVNSNSSLFAVAETSMNTKVNFKPFKANSWLLTKDQFSNTQLIHSYVVTPRALVRERRCSRVMLLSGYNMFNVLLK